jgi:hypothetical protein
MAAWHLALEDCAAPAWIYFFGSGFATIGNARHVEQITPGGLWFRHTLSP